MQQPFTLPADNSASNRRQAYALLLLGVVFLIIAWLGFLNPYALGVLLFGLGMLGVAPLSRRRFLSAGWFLSRFPSGCLDQASLCSDWLLW